MQQGRFRASGMVTHHHHTPSTLLSLILDYRTGGSFLASRRGSLFPSAEVMSSGIRCGSPTECGQSRCFYHHSVRMLLPKRFVARESFRNEWEHGVRMFPMPLLEDATSIQTALMQVIHAMLEGALPVPTARIVLSALRHRSVADTAMRPSRFRLRPTVVPLCSAGQSGPRDSCPTGSTTSQAIATHECL